MGNNQKSSKMESGKITTNKSKNENGISTVRVKRRSQVLSQKCGLQMIIKTINFKTLPYPSTLCSKLQTLPGSFDTKANVIMLGLSSAV